MVRFVFGLFFGVVLTVEALVIGGVGHGSYAPLVLDHFSCGPNTCSWDVCWSFSLGILFLLIPRLCVSIDLWDFGSCNNGFSLLLHFSTSDWILRAAT